MLVNLIRSVEKPYSYTNPYNVKRPYTTQSSDTKIEYKILSRQSIFERLFSRYRTLVLVYL